MIALPHHICTAPMRHAALLACLLSTTGIALAQQLPPPGRTIFKCVQAGKTSYSDEPCLGAQKLDIVVPRGLNKLSGTQRTGTDVFHEVSRENFANAIRPLTGMKPDQLETAGRRRQLGAAAQSQCRQLDQSIPQLERAETRAGKAELPALQHDLLQQRKAFKSGGC